MQIKGSTLRLGSTNRNTRKLAFSTDIQYSSEDYLSPPLYYFSSGRFGISRKIEIKEDIICSKPIYDATLREPTVYEVERAEFLKARMKAAGLWDNPFAFWRTSGAEEED